MADDKIIDLKSERDRRDDPDAEHVYIDEKGVKWFTYLIDFDIDDKTFSFRIFATDNEDAAQRVAAIKNTARVEGVLHKELPA